MARRSKKKKEMDLIEAALMIPMFVTFYLVYTQTNSLKVAGIASGMVLGIVIAILIIRRMNHEERLKKSGIADIDKMEGREFEQYLGHLFKGHGYAVKVTQEAGDFGADLVIEKDKKKIVVQAKRYSKNVGIKAVQEAQASMAHYGAVEAWVVSNSDFTTAAYTLAKSNRVKLIHRQALIEMMLQTKQAAPGIQPSIQKEENVQSIITKIEQPKRVDPVVEDVTCARCGSNMVRRKGPRGEFLGCGNFPKCRNTIDLTSQ